MGIGQSKTKEKDYLKAYLEVHLNYKEMYENNKCKKKEFGTNPLNFVGIMAPIFCGAVAEKAKLYFKNDDDARMNGLIVGDEYYLSQDNTLGLPAGILKVIQEDNLTA